MASTAVRSTSSSMITLSSFLNSLFSSTAVARQKETLADRVANVSRLQITPLKFVGYQSQVVAFSALPTNFAGETIQGVKVTWESSNPEKVQIDDAGQATLLEPGLARITCRAGLVETTVPILVRPGLLPQQTDQQWREDQNSLRADGTISAVTTGSAASARINASLLDKLVPTAHAQSGYPAVTANDVLYDELWNEPRNLVGGPPYTAVEPTKLGTVLPEGSNFNISIPLMNVGGRGLGASLALSYNSRLWSRHGNAVTYDAVAGWPSPGFILGFGRVVTYGTATVTKYIWVDPSGTRHYLGQGGAPSQTVTLRATDGSNVTYVGNTWSGTLYSNDGTKVKFTLQNNRLVATQVTDSNGNYISISYLDITCEQGCEESCGCPVYWPALSIQQITDSLGRIIQFNYDTDLKLTSISAPAYGGTSQNPLSQTVVEFDYEIRTPSASFSGLAVENATSYRQFIRRVRFPATNTGYLFTYSAYGMIYSYSLRHSMSSSGTPTDGTEKAKVSFNYPTSASSLTDTPAFTQRTESATSSPTGTYTYTSSTDAVAQTRSFKVTRPDSSELWLTRSTNTSSLASGLLVQSEIKSGTTSFSKSTVSYANDAGGAKQIQSVTSYDDVGTPTKKDFDYDQYGNVTNIREYGHQINGSWQVRRRIKNTFKTDTAYVNAHLRGLVTQVEVLDALENTNDTDDVVIAKKACTYDDYTVMGGMENYGGTANPPGHLTSYNTTYTVRGNITGKTEWTDISSNTSITRNTKYDIFGNVVKAQVSCCQEKSFTCTESNCWGPPEELISGSTSGIHLKETVDTDFNTGLVKSRTDASNQTIDKTYDQARRNTVVTYPTGATRYISYNDATLSITATSSYDDNGVERNITTTAYQDGWGRDIQTGNVHGGQVNTSYDAIGRVLTTTNPFPSGGQPGPLTTYQYDALGRRTLVTLPDGNTIQQVYSGSTVTNIDHVNRKTRHEYDGLGRLVKAVEQTAAGALSQESTYSYDLLNDLVQVNQGGQLRKFKYDSLGRMLFERIPEQSATINDGTGAMWSSKFTYTDFGDVLTRTDARGVVTTYGYDVLHRLTSIGYNVANAPGVASTPTVTYTYDNTTTSATNGLLLRVDVGTAYRESYTYDIFDRVSAVTATLDGRNYVTNYAYNEAGQPTQIGNMYHEYDTKGRLAGVSSFLYEITYNVAGQVTGDKLSTPGVTETFTYDNNRLQMTGQTATKGTTTLMSLTYGFQASAGQMGAGTTAGNAGQLMSISGTINSQTEQAAYTYDNVVRLVTSSQTTNGVSHQRRFDYDRWGNRTAVYDALTGGTQIQSVSLQQASSIPTNRISSVTQNTSTVNYVYDSAGNVTDDGAHTYQYDAESRLVAVDSGATAQYSYDHQNRRYKKVTGGVGTHYMWNGNQVLSEHNASTGVVQVSYVYAGSRMIAKSTASGLRYMLNDRLGARLILNHSGTVVGRQAHLPFGEEIGGSGEQDKHHFTTYERDTETDTDYALNRQYSENAGRFTRPDPYRGSNRLGGPQSFNRYAYVRNDPINKTDPTGLDGLFYIEYCVTDMVAVDGQTVLDYGFESCESVEMLGDGDPIEVRDAPSIGQCNEDLEDRLADAYGAKRKSPSLMQLALAQKIAGESGAKLNQLLATWSIESDFISPAPNGSIAFGPLALTVGIGRNSPWSTGFTPAETLGNTSSRTFTGSEEANVTTGSRYLDHLNTLAGGDMAMGGVAYRWGEGFFRQDPARMSNKQKFRLNWYKKSMEAFNSYVQCVKNVIDFVDG